jgi:LPXTG-site transpeptidase (sortase) family protein
LSGHNATNGEIFRYLYTLDISDEVVLYADEISRTYRVSETLVLPEAGQPLEVRLQNARYAKPTEDERLTLITCHPYGSLRNRLIVIAVPKDEDRGFPALEESHPPE